MGIESSPDLVEESTEPPICPYTAPFSNPNATQTSLSFELGDTNEKSHSTIAHRLSADTNGRPPLAPAAPQSIAPDKIYNTHLLEPNEIVSLLKTDLQYAEIRNAQFTVFL